jgi:CheY-like chemotaxis protein
VTFPAGAENQATLGAGPSDGSPPPFVPARRIMIVDDEPMITRTLQLALEQIGYTVTTYNLPEQALARFRAGPADFDLIITDYWMPALNGLDLATQVRACNPNVGIVLFSGYSVRLTPRQVQELGLNALLSKPIEISTIAGVLDAHFARQT